MSDVDLLKMISCNYVWRLYLIHNTCCQYLMSESQSYLNFRMYPYRVDPWLHIPGMINVKVKQSTDWLTCEVVVFLVVTVLFYLTRSLLFAFAEFEAEEGAALWCCKGFYHCFGCLVAVITKPWTFVVSVCVCVCVCVKRGKIILKYVG